MLILLEVGLRKLEEENVRFIGLFWFIEIAYRLIIYGSTLMATNLMAYY